MKVTRITIKNVMGLDELIIQPGQITRVHGKNGAGKTSIKRALQSIIDGGNPAEIRRQGTDKSSVEVQTDGGITVTKTLTEGKADVKVSMGNNINIGTPATYIKQLFGTSFNPVSFLELNDKKRLDEVLDRIPMAVTKEEVEFVVGQPLPGVDFNQHGLKVLNTVR